MSKKPYAPLHGLRIHTYNHNPFYLVVRIFLLKDIAHIIIIVI